MKDFHNEYGYETLLKDACYPAIEGHSRLSTGILEVQDQFSLLYGTKTSFSAALSYYNKTQVEFKKDVIATYKSIKRKQRKNRM